MTETNVPHWNVDRSFVLRVSVIAALSGLLYGYDMGIIAAALLYVRNTFDLSAGMEEAVVSVVLLGAMLGALLGGTVADRIGRKKTLVQAALIFVCGSVLAPLSPNVGVLIVARAVLGLAIGFTSVTAPVYVSELAPPQSRGGLIGLYQLALTLGIAIANLVGYFLSGQKAWRLMFGIGAAPAILFLMLVLSVPESARWLASKQRFEEAAAVIRSYAAEPAATWLLQEIRQSVAAKLDQRWASLWSPGIRKPLAIAVSFTVLQQITGINTIIYYGPQIFAMAGFGSDQSDILATFVVAAVNVLATLIALALVDRIGRKPLLYGGVSGMMVSLVAISLAFHSASGRLLGTVAIVSLIAYILCFAASLGPIAWILVSEVFPQRVRGRGVAAATLGSGLANAAVSLTFLSLIHAVGSPATFALFALFCLVTLVFVRFGVPETMGRELESISFAPTADAPAYDQLEPSH
ncbi:sugar porter family MFS transporter [Terriglobus aquaticus]|uniref:Sugar porter family MFS transporter n=1 Tax=Terriglobus aquaticus TaxID=940139 RepID=A0ABW9KIY4_9BACT|nr:sugar porter family MFS transporter [Terriglobus aquaticus]